MLEAINIKKTYSRLSKPLNVLKGIDLKISEGQMVAIVGPSGAGKSTLLHILGGLDNPDEGKVILDADDLYTISDSERAKVRNRKVGFVFQFYHLMPEFTALENVLLPKVIKENKNNFKSIKEDGLKLLERVGLKDRAEHKPYQLSGGEQQRVAIARALINEPRVIFCDEPTGNLDSQSGKGVIEFLIELNKKNHQTLVIVTHDNEIAKISNRTFHMKDGMLI